MMASTSSALGHKQTDRQEDRGTVTEETLPRFNKQTNVKKNYKKNKQYAELPKNVRNSSCECYCAADISTEVSMLTS